jgi:hypothetical protein
LAGERLIIVGIGLLAGGMIYSLATDDPEARAKMLGTRRDRGATAGGPDVDIRDRSLKREPEDSRSRHTVRS